MELKVSADKVNYDPKTNEYTVKVNLDKLGSLFDTPIYVYNIDYGTYFSIVSTLSQKFRYEFNEYK